MLNSPSRMLLPPSLWPAVYRSVTTQTWPPAERDQAGAFVRACVAHGLLSLLTAADVPDSVRAALTNVRAMERANIERMRILRETFQRLATIMTGEPFIVLKGLDYAFRIYDEPHLRQMADIDILIPRSRTGTVAARFRAEGIQRNYPAGAATRLATHHEMVFDFAGVTVEPHHSFVQKQRHKIDYDAVWHRRVPFEVDGVSTFRLCDEDAILYAALTLATNEFDLPLSRYLDLYLLLQAYRGDDRLLASRAKEWRIENAFFAAIDRTSIVFPELVDRVQPLLETLLTSRRRQFLRRRVLPEILPRVRRTRGQQLWRKFHLMDGYRERAGFLLYHLYASIAGKAMAARSRIADSDAP